ncbi:hypothetical protein LMG7974_00366 [Campylobacter majalis]|uniref:Chemotaxis methyl-accepting receptor HlyB-like 4HB MCP domain-containing protein n=1 Tax=Campylobacter majalis TaxID=2790656 RepID=A0ABN7K529_9BACT|nr:hypothetical protein [Campylobacter majalis]CAD7287487.1 hypothetical protein LMG7974_00366 [Campylobacter majalis]
MFANKTLPVIIAISIIVMAGVFFAINKSYQLSFGAKVYYELGNYAKANEMSIMAYELDIYNKMAANMIRKSGDALKLQRYINQGEEYLKQINDMANQSVTKIQQERIRMMCDIMLDEYDDIVKSVFYDKLLSEARQMRDSFATLKKELFY